MVDVPHELGRGGEEQGHTVVGGAAGYQVPREVSGPGSEEEDLGGGCAAARVFEGGPGRGGFGGG